MAIEKVKMKCNSCDGVLEIDGNSNVMFCPYCGSKEMLLFSDDVEIERIRSDATIKQAQMSYLNELELRTLKYEQKERARKARFKRFLIIVGIYLGMFVFVLVFFAILGLY